jgi:hypothetical protein
MEWALFLLLLSAKARSRWGGPLLGKNEIWLYSSRHFKLISVSRFHDSMFASPPSGNEITVSEGSTWTELETCSLVTLGQLKSPSSFFFDSSEVVSYTNQVHTIICFHMCSTTFNSSTLFCHFLSPIFLKHEFWPSPNSLVNKSCLAAKGSYCPKNSIRACARKLMLISPTE